MRVTGGDWRGRRLDAVPGSRVRPSTDRLREALFSIIGDAVVGAVVADLCCGSGTLGIEALSRRAGRVDFVDLAPTCLATVQQNLQRCGAEPDRWRLHRGDAVRWLRRHLARTGPPVLVLADPPYGGPVAGALFDLLLGAAPARILVAAIEHAPGAGPQATTTVGWDLQERAYGRSNLTLLRPPVAGAPEVEHA
jgi:16S rRNA (guanine966-N2)-methyltransferase